MKEYICNNKWNILLGIAVSALFFISYSVDTVVYSQSSKGELCTPTSLTKCWNGCKEGFQNIDDVCVECPQTPHWTYWKAGSCLVCGGNNQEPCPPDRCRIWTTLNGSSKKCEYCPSWTNSYSEGTCEECGKRGLRTCIARPTGVPGGTAFCKDWEYRAKSADSTCSACGYENEIPCPRLPSSTLPVCITPFSSFTNISDITKCSCAEGAYYNTTDKTCTNCGGNGEKSCPVTFTTSWSCKLNVGLEKKTNNTCGCPAWTTWDGSACVPCGEKHGMRICGSQTEKCRKEFVMDSDKCVCATGEDPSDDLKTCARCGEYKAKQCKKTIVATGTKCRSNLKEKDVMTGVTGATCSCDKNLEYDTQTEKCTACERWKYSDPPYGKETCQTCGGNGDVPCPLPSVSGKECNDILGLAKNAASGTCACPGETEYNADADTQNKCESCGHNNEKACVELFATNSGCKSEFGLKNVSGKCVCSGWTIWDTNNGKCVTCGQEHYQRACTGKTPECAAQFTSKNNICYCNAGTKPSSDYKNCSACGGYKGDLCSVSPANSSVCKNTLTPSSWMDGINYPLQKCMCKEHTELNPDNGTCKACPDWTYSYPSQKIEICGQCGEYNITVCPWERKIDGQQCKINLGLTSIMWNETIKSNVCVCSNQVFKNGKCEDCDAGTIYNYTTRSCISCGGWKERACQIKYSWGYGIDWNSCQSGTNPRYNNKDYQHYCSCSAGNYTGDSDYTYSETSCIKKYALFNKFTFDNSYYAPYYWTDSASVKHYYGYAYDEEDARYIYFPESVKIDAIPTRTKNGSGYALAFANNIPGSPAVQHAYIAWGDNYGAQTTISIWINSSNVNPSKPASFLGGPSHYGYANIYSYVAVYGGIFQVYVYGSGWQVSDTILNPNTWYHFALSYDTSTKAWKMYVNGKQEKSGTANESVTNGSVYYIGAYGPNSLYNFNGLLDDYRFFKKVLTDTEVMEIYNNPPK